MKRTGKLIAFILIVSLACVSLTSCFEALGEGYSEYAVSRDVEGRDVRYVEICFENYGKVILLLDATTAPKTVENFLNLVNEGFYNGLTMHRIMPDFMIQGGDPDANGSGGSKNYVEGEFASNGHRNDIKHLRGVISMARSNDYDSATSQFFICNSDAKSLDGEYAAFGYVIMGMSVIDELTEDSVKYTRYYEWYGTEYHQIWQQYGNGMIESKKNQPVIKYIKELKNYTPNFDYSTDSDK